MKAVIKLDLPKYQIGEEVNLYFHDSMMTKGIAEADTTNEIITCKDCKHWESDVMELIDGFPIIVAHSICNKWGGGCQTNPDGYCHLAEKRESEGEANE